MGGGRGLLLKICLKLVFRGTLRLILKGLLRGNENVIFAMDGSKAPGLDGFSMNFYQVCWDIIKDPMKVFLESFDKGGSKS